MASSRKETSAANNIKHKGFPCLYFEEPAACTCNNDVDDPGDRTRVTAECFAGQASEDGDEKIGGI